MTIYDDLRVLKTRSDSERILKKRATWEPGDDIVYGQLRDDICNLLPKLLAQIIPIFDVRPLSPAPKGLEIAKVSKKELDAALSYLSGRSESVALILKIKFTEQEIKDLANAGGISTREAHVIVEEIMYRALTVGVDQES